MPTLWRVVSHGPIAKLVSLGTYATLSTLKDTRRTVLIERVLRIQEPIWE